MSDVAIQVEGLGKQYRIGGVEDQYVSLRDSILKLPRSIARRVGGLWTGETPGAGSDVFWALKDVSFEIGRGEVIGVLGRNGAGKSTLLKMLCRVTEPTEGQAIMHGRVGALLEVATGFDPELTGRENIFLSGAILGMRKAEIARKFDEIVAFAELEKFLDTPVKRYSSGMYVRLGFAVAAHLEPEILLIDEVLAVGDETFKRKCLGKMGEVGKGGRTVLFVSHNLNSISTLTERSLVLEKGELIFFGNTDEALATYRSLWTTRGLLEYVDENKTNGVIRGKVCTSEANQVHRYGEPLAFEFEILFEEKPKAGALSVQIVDERARPVVHLWLYDSELQWSKTGRAKVRCQLDHPRIYMGRYTLNTTLSDTSSLHEYETLNGICPFEVVMDGIPKEGGWEADACTYLEESQWVVE